ncbi:CRISPR system Cascade subunit CasB [Crossiella equi]|uniref:CRISPR system Cascade subunit CasB n=1 Tax=Crossiella equi TaxID=130796 RepID=A0ABS5AM16_9PSEU|nr:type I-E CRISPR-associated protein Cse2/CasB [Crossiella equi]MBP2477613.1 CRISPR system Cascade subunit CasB [Crossiella equi]
MSTALTTQAATPARATTVEERFVERIQQLCARSAAARNQLRRTERRRPEDASRAVHQVVARWLPDNPSPGRERAYYTVAALIAAQPNTTHRATDEQTSPEADDTEPAARARTRWANLGGTLARACLGRPAGAKTIGFASAERHLELICRQGLHGLHRHLPTVIRRMSEIDASPDWARLLNDLARWENTPRLVAKQWQQAFYRTAYELDPDALETGE